MNNIIPITDFNAPELDIYARLTENQLINREDPEHGMFIAESPKVIERALDAGYIPVSFLMETCHVETQAKDILARCDGLNVFTAELDVLMQLTGFKLTRGLLCAMYRRPLPSVSEICRGTSRVAVLEDVVNPTNVGAIIRSAAALGIDAVLLTSASSDPLYRRAIRVSMGTVFQIPWTYLPQGGSWTDVMHELGFKTAAMALLDDTRDIGDPELLSEKKLAIALGTEGDGLKSTSIKGCDYTVKIPMFHGVDSLNVAAASAVAFYQLCRQS